MKEWLKWVAIVGGIAFVAELGRFDPRVMDESIYRLAMGVIAGGLVWGTVCFGVAKAWRAMRGPKSGGAE